jgi:hypothetical protein
LFVWLNSSVLSVPFMMNKQTINLMLPGLWTLLRTVQQHDPDIGTRLPALTRFLSRSDQTVDSDMEVEDRVLEKLGLSADQPAPIAALERLADPDANPDGWWLRADPVNLVADRQFVVMQHPGSLELNEDEARHLIARINKHFAEDGWQLEMATPNRWYLRLSTPLDLITTPAWRVTGKDIDTYIPAGKDGLKWHAWLNEVQMLLYTDEPSTVTGIWIWGGGAVGSSSPKLQMGLWGDIPFLQGLGRHTELTCRDLPANWQDLTSASSESGEEIVWLDNARQALMSGNMEQGISVLEQLEEDVFKPLLKLLKGRRFAQLNICDLPGHEVQVSAGGLRRWWRHRKPIYDLNL